MAAQPTSPRPDLHVPEHPVRIVSASALFDGHDASINIMRRIMQSQGAEVIHLGHNRSVREVVDAAIEEDVQGVAVSSYQGGHVEYFEYLVQLLREAGAGHVHVVGGGGGVIVPTEVARLREAGVTIFSPEDGQRLGLPGMVNEVIKVCDTDLWEAHPTTAAAVLSGERSAIARALTAAETGHLSGEMRAELERAASGRRTPVLGITGTGGSGKSSLTDELVRRLRVDQQDKLRIACVAIDPTRRRGGGALLGDRIRMNALDGDRVFFRSLATRGSHEVPEALGDVLTILKGAAFDLVVVETPGIGQGDAAITTFADVGVTALYQELRGLLAERGLEVSEGALHHVDVRHSSVLRQVVPPQRVRYLAAIAEPVRGYHDDTTRYAAAARRVQRLTEVGTELEHAGSERSGVDALLQDARQGLPLPVAHQLAGWSSV